MRFLKFPIILLPHHVHQAALANIVESLKSELVMWLHDGHGHDPEDARAAADIIFKECQESAQSSFLSVITCMEKALEKHRGLLQSWENVLEGDSGRNDGLGERP